MAEPIKSIWDDDTPTALRERAVKGLDAWDRAHASDDPAIQLSELRDAYSHFRMAAREAKRERFAEVIFYWNMSALMTGEVTKWRDRLKAAREASKAALHETGWLLFLYGSLIEDITQMELAPARAREQLWEDAHRHTDTSYGIAILGNLVMQRAAMPPALKRQYRQLAREIGQEIGVRLETVENYGSSSPDAASLPLAVESVADALAEDEIARRYSVVLYQALARLPDGDWERAEGSQPAKTAEQHRDHAEARLEFARRRGGGCAGAVAATIATVVSIIMLAYLFLRAA